MSDNRQVGAIVMRQGQRFRITARQETGDGPWCSFDYVRKDGERDRRWRSFSGTLSDDYLPLPHLPEGPPMTADRLVVIQASAVKPDQPRRWFVKRTEAERSVRSCEATVLDLHLKPIVPASEWAVVADLATDAEPCGKQCDHGSPCALPALHDAPDRHETQHGCIFYDEPSHA